MSADNWTFCPKCRETKAQDRAKRQQEIDEYKEKLNAAYGKVSREDYEEMWDKEPQHDYEEPLDETFREDRNIGIDDEDGEFSMAFSGSCNDCDYMFTVRLEIPYGSKKAKLTYDHRTQEIDL